MDEELEAEQEALAALPRIYMNEDRFGSLSWRNGDRIFRSKALADEQRAAMKNAERLLRKQGSLEETCEYLASLSVLPHFLWGRARFDIAHIWSSPEILKASLGEEDEDEDENEDDARREQSSVAGSMAQQSTQGSIFTVEAVDDDWTDDEDDESSSQVAARLASEAQEMLQLPEQEAATSENANYVDAVLDVFEGLLDALRDRDAELEVEKETRLKAGAAGGFTLQKRERYARAHTLQTHEQLLI